MEIRPIPGFPDYYVTDTGDVYSTKRSKDPIKMALIVTKLNYRTVKIGWGGFWPRKLVHRLVAMAFLPDYTETLHVNHLDGNPSNNHVSNLEMCTHQQNIQHSFTLGHRDHKGNKAHRRILTEEQVLYIRDTLERKIKTIKELAKEFKVHNSTIGKIKNRKNWAHI